MAYLKINDKDFSPYVRGLTITKTNNYNSQTNAAGNTVVDYINRKRTFVVSFIYIDDETMQQLQEELNMFNVFISFRNPDTGVLEEDVNCIIPNTKIEYYTIQANKVLFKEFDLTFNEL